MMRGLEQNHDITIDSMFVPSRFLSGDVWGIVDLGAEMMGIWICDFSGKGIRAALHTFRLHTLIQEFRHCADDPTEIVDALNSRLVKVMPEGQFSTFLMGVVDFKRDVFTYASASSTHPLIYFPEERRFEVGDGTGVPLGVIDQQSYPLKTMPFPKGSSLVLYSDMLWESDALPGMSFQPEDLAELGVRLNGSGLVNAVKEKISPLKDYHFVDDLTLIEIHRNKGTGHV
jgi:sigma-B regulation protein RsbU (phosphoserine phosphatase)